MSLHKYAPSEILDYLEVLETLPVTVHKARSSHTISMSIPFALLQPLKKTAQDMGLTFMTGKFYKNQCQIIVKSEIGLM